MLKKKLLLVDDDDNIRFLADMSLEDTWDVVCASSGKKALAIAREERPDVILLDMMMPEMDGETTMRLLREIDGFDKLPIIFMTAKVQNHEVDHYLKIGAAGVIVKPFDPMKISEQIFGLMMNPVV